MRFHQPFLTLALTGLLLLHIGNSSDAENWTRFRGPNGTGLSKQKGFPTSWNRNDYAWVIDISGMGHSSPVVWKDYLFLTTAEKQGRVRKTICLDSRTGVARWSREIAMKSNHNHRKGSWASPSPATDGKRVYTVFCDAEKYLLVAYTLDGQFVWQKDLGTYKSQHGHGVSPIVYDGKVILTNNQQGPSSVTAFDAKTGEIVWNTVQAVRRAAYSTPFIHHVEGEPQVICASGAGGLTALNPQDGKVIWKTHQFPQRTVASPILSNGLIVQSCGSGGRGTLLIAVDPSGRGEVDATHVRFRRKRSIPYVPTPISYNKLLFLLNDNGVLICMDLNTSREIWKMQLGANFSGSPICIDGKLYLISEAGDVRVISADREKKDYGTVSLGDPSYTTPAVSGGKLYFRTFHKLFCLPVKG